MTAREQLIAYLATLAALVTIIVAALLIGSMSSGVLNKMEAFGLGTAVGGLIGVLRIPSLRTPTVNTEQGDISVDQTTTAGDK